MFMFTIKNILLFSIIVLSGCHQVTANADSVAARAASNSVSQASSHAAAHIPQPNLLEDRTTLESAQASLQSLPIFAGKTIQVVGDVDFFDGIKPRIELSVQNPNQADQIWLMRFQHGKWSEPIIDELSEYTTAEQIAPHLTPLNQIHFVDVATIASLWRDKAKEVNAAWQEPYYVAFIWLPKLKKRFWHTAEIEAVGAQYYLSVDLNGNIWEWKKL